MKAHVLWGLLILSTATGSAQSVQAITNSSGGSFHHEHVLLEWNVGEMSLVETMFTSDGSQYLTHGLLQPLMMMKDPNPVFGGFEVKILPNPTAGKVEVNLLTAARGIVYMNLFDNYGKNVGRKQAMSNGTGTIDNIDLSALPAGIYYLKIEMIHIPGSPKKAGTYKIIKL